jgi:hypothetical protein
MRNHQKLRPTETLARNATLDKVDDDELPAPLGAHQPSEANVTDIRHVRMATER